MIAQTLPDRLALAVSAHPDVVELVSGPVGTVTSYLPGRLVPGVRVDEVTGTVELSVVLRLGRPLPQVIEEVRAAARSVAGATRVDVTVADVVSPDAVDPAQPRP